MTLQRRSVTWMFVNWTGTLIMGTVLNDDDLIRSLSLCWLGSNIQNLISRNPEIAVQKTQGLPSGPSPNVKE